MVQNQMAPGTFPQFAQTPGLEEFQQPTAGAMTAGAMTAGAIPITAQPSTTVPDPQTQYTDPTGVVPTANNGVEQQTVSKSVSSVSSWQFGCSLANCDVLIQFNVMFSSDSINFPQLLNSQVHGKTKTESQYTPIQTTILIYLVGNVYRIGCMEYSQLSYIFCTAT